MVCETDHESLTEASFSTYAASREYIFFKSLRIFPINLEWDSGEGCSDIRARRRGRKGASIRGLTLRFSCS